METIKKFDQLKEFPAFEMESDALEPEYHRGDIVICQEIKKDQWRTRLPLESWDFVIDHQSKGKIIKQIVDHNIETGEIVCRSINSEGDPDLTLKLSDVSSLYNVVEHRIPMKNARKNR